MNRKNLIDAAMGRTDADLILKNGSVLDVFTGTLKKADVMIKDGYICGGNTRNAGCTADALRTDLVKLLSCLQAKTLDGIIINIRRQGS